MSGAKGLKTENLIIGYDSDLAEGISLSVKPGQIVTLIGPNGSGKSTLLKTLAGQLTKRGGVIYLGDTDMSGMNASEVAKELSILLTNPVNPELMTCREVVETGRYPYTGRFGILSERDHTVVERTLKMTGTDEYADREFGAISDGQRQRIMLARAICQEPEVLILDEPTSYLDIRYKLDILRQIKTLAEEQNMALIMSLHELDIAMRISDVVIAMGEGGIKRTGTCEEVFEESFIRDLYGLGASDTDLLGAEPWMRKAPSLKGNVKIPEATAKGHHPVIMVQGTMSAAGKSMIVAGLCRIFKQDGYRVAPFKSQNMALNSYVTPEGLEIGRAQAMQAECCQIEPLACMNPILLKPTDAHGSQIIVNGSVVGNMRASEYFKYRAGLKPKIMEAYDKLCSMTDIIVVEGAGSPAEINLKHDDIVNMGLAGMLDAPVLLVGDIDRGGVFAQLIGTVDLLDEDERSRVRGLIVNKFRGDRSLFEDGVRMLEERSGIPVTGVVPYMNVKLDDEDSLSERFHVREKKKFDIAVVRLPHISNFTDMDVFEQSDDISVRYIDMPEMTGTPDMLILPGSKNTIGDLKWLKSSGLADSVRDYVQNGGVVFGICGGYQMLGLSVSDPHGLESGGTETGLGLLNVKTVIGTGKERVIFDGTVSDAEGILAPLKGTRVRGYEIHMGHTSPCGEVREFTSGGTGYCSGNIYGTYIHGVFDEAAMAAGCVDAIAALTGRSADTSVIMDYSEFKQTQYDILADTLRAALDMESIYAMMGVTR